MDNKTKIFKSYEAFLARPDKATNGVSPEFATHYPDYVKQNVTNAGCYDCSDCTGCSDCSECIGCYRCSQCTDCTNCSGSYCCIRCIRCTDCTDCFDCSDCSHCSRGSRCTDCTDCTRCSDCSGCLEGLKLSGTASEMAAFVVPILKNIHQQVLAAASAPYALNMDEWHSCETTHCRAGWVEHLAGDAGRVLTAKTSTLFAAMQIYHKSSPGIVVHTNRFFTNNAAALADMRRCAALEIEQQL